MMELLKYIESKDLIQNISGIGTFIASIVSLITLFILKKQRKDSFRPTIIFGDRLNAKCLVIDNEKILKSRWIDAYNITNTVFCFELLNVGVGVAQNVKLIESFDIHKAIKFIKKYDSKNEFIFVENKDILEIKTTFDNSYLIYYSIEAPRKIGTFLPLKNNKKNVFEFNYNVLNFLCCYDYLKTNISDLNSLSKFPTLNFEIIYENIEGKKYYSKYECKVSSFLTNTYTFVFLKKK